MSKKLTLPDAALARRVPVDNEIQGEAVEAMRAVKFRIPANVITAAIAGMLDRRIITNDQADAMQWFAGYCRARNADRDEIGSMLAKIEGGGFYAWDSIYQLLTGRRADQGANVIPMIDAIKDFRKSVESASVRFNRFIVTGTVRGIFAAFDEARDRHRIAFVIGESQFGKTESGLYYTTSNNHGATVMVDTPERASLPQFQAHLGRMLGLGSLDRASSLPDKILESFRSGMFLIIDNFHRALRRPNAYLLTDFVQRIYDECGIGVGIYMTHEGRQEILKGKNAHRLRQLWRRRIKPIEIPDPLPPEDLAAFAASRGLEPAPSAKIGIEYDAIINGALGVEKYIASPAELQTLVLKTDGLQVWLDILDHARVLAAAAGKSKPTWKAVLRAYCHFR